MEQTHELRLKIDAAAAEAGSKRFTAALSAVKKAVSDLDRAADGTFAKLANHRPEFNVAPITKATTATRELSTAMDKAGTASTKVGTQSQRAALAASMAMRQATTSAQKLAFRLEDLGDTAGVDRLDAAIDRLHAQLARAPDVAAVRVARSAYEDLRVEMTQTATAAEYARGAQAQLDRQARETAAAVDQHAASIASLRAEFQPLYQVSKNYEAQLDRIAKAERESILTSGQAETARQRAAQALLTAGQAADTFAGSGRNAAFAAQQVGFQLTDIAVMLQGGMSPLSIMVTQGGQLAGTFQTLGSRAQVFSALKSGLLGMVSPMSLITYGAIGLGAALYYGLSKAIPPTKSLAEALKDLDAAMNTAKSTAGEAANLEALTQKYAGARAEVQALANAKRDLARLEAETAYKDAKSSFYSDVGFNRWWDSLRGFAGTEEGRVRKLAQDFDLTTEAATRLNEQLLKAQSATTAETAASYYGQMRQTIVDAAGGMEKLTTAQKEVVGKINEMEGKAREFARLDMAKPVTDATTAANGLATSMSGVAAQALRVLNTLQALAGIKVNISAPVISTPALPKATPIAAPKASGDIFDRITNVTDVSYQPVKAAVTSTSTPAATKPAAAMTSRELQAVITASVTRTGALQAEKSAAEQLTDRLTSLQAETLTLQTVAAGTYATEEAARLYAEAATTAGGAIDDQTAAMIRQIDAAGKLNDELQRLVKDPAKEWLDSVPTWVEAGRHIEEQALDSLSNALADFATTGRFDINALGDAIAGTAARVVSDMAVKELVGMLGGNVTGAGAAGFGLGDLFGAMFGTVGAFAEGGLSTSPVGFASLTPANFRHAPHFAEGTANTSGIPAVLHDNEAVIPLSRGRKVGVELNGGTSTGGTIINAPQTITITTPDADSFRRSKKQVAADLAVAGARAARQNR
ncbi:tail tape-measure protein [Gemmobacter caeni]|uniref:Tail tape-measure protein n=1 Tax=Gemmobacter caeni TaxID=589035 RepID=A0A2T6B5C6_9RHOB|nr:phage tail length tape measure family protein [Gemmobacter caeni]PTX51232.1 tail tape-measure protein [Gemmobacter caeni]TWJ01232.1 tail tape-measure protein [Gemmobacter caeni]